MVSVVIPVYQAKANLRRCVDSWLAQTRQDFELILVDDGSTDGSAELCDAYGKREERIKVIHQKNAGVSAARNAGIEAASGTFLMFTDSDDYVSEDYLEKMTAFQEKTAADLVLCGFHHLFEGADILKLPGQTGVWRMADFKDEFLDLYEKSYLNMPWNKLFLREKVRRFDESLSLGEDLLFNLEYMKSCSCIGILAEPLCFYIQEESKTTLSSQKRQNRMELGRMICEETEQFFDGMWKDGISDGRILVRYFNEILDECEKLPSDGSMSYGEKLAVIRGYAKDEWVRERGGEVKMTLPDYRILWPLLRKEMAGTVYFLCVIRRMVVTVVHAMRRKTKNGTVD